MTKKVLDLSNAVWYRKRKKGDRWEEKVVISDVSKEDIKYYEDMVVECWNTDDKHINKWWLDDVYHIYKDEILTIYLILGKY